MKVLVTGGAGFIGSHLVDALLAAGHEVAVLDDLSSGRPENLPSNVHIEVGDVRDRAVVERAFAVRPAIVFHEAAQLSVSRSVREPLFDAEVNVLGLLNVLDCCVRFGTRKVVFASSGGVLYGDVFEPATETAPCEPVSPYGIAKWASERYLQFYAREHGLQTVALRYANVYGPRQDARGEAGVVAIFAKKMLAGEQAVINGDGRYVRDYVFVRDVARANLLAMERPLGKPFVALNVGTAIGTDVNQLAGKLRAFCLEVRRSSGLAGDVPEPRHGPHRPGDLRSNIVSVEKAAATLGWRPQTLLDDGLRETVAWFAARMPGEGS